MVVLLVIVWLGYEMVTAPLMSDDYDIEEDLETDNKDKNKNKI